MRRLAPVLALLLVPVAGCGQEDGDTTLIVYAAASLTAAFEQVAADFEAEHEGVDVELTFGGSSDLVTQIQEGAPADVFASADTATMDALVDADLVGAGPQVFATNTLEIAVPPGNPAGVASVQDLAEPGLQLVVCAPEVPCGAAAQRVAEAAGVTLAPVSEEQSVTDVRAAGDDVEGIEFPESGDVVNAYPIAPVDGSDEADLADEFVAFVLGGTGQRVLADAGFGSP